MPERRSVTTCPFPSWMLNPMSTTNHDTSVDQQEALTEDTEAPPPAQLDPASEEALLSRFQNLSEALKQVASSISHLAVVPAQLLGDGTYAQAKCPLCSSERTFAINGKNNGKSCEYHFKRRLRAIGSELRSDLTANGLPQTTSTLEGVDQMIEFDQERQVNSDEEQGTEEIPSGEVTPSSQQRHEVYLAVGDQIRLLQQELDRIKQGIADLDARAQGEPQARGDSTWAAVNSNRQRQSQSSSNNTGRLQIAGDSVEEAIELSD